MSQTLQEKNKALLLESFDVLFNKRDSVGVEKYWSPNYIQHSSHIEPGRDSVATLQILREAPKRTGLTMVSIRAAISSAGIRLGV